MSIVIKKDVSVPVRPFSPDSYPFAKMQVGDMFEIEMPGNGSALYNSAHRYKTQHPGTKFRTKKEGNLIRVWRIE